MIKGAYKVYSSWEFGFYRHFCQAVQPACDSIVM